MMWQTLFILLAAAFGLYVLATVWLERQWKRKLHELERRNAILRQAHWHEIARHQCSSREAGRDVTREAAQRGQTYSVHSDTIHPLL